MNTNPVTIPSEPTTRAPLSDNPIAARALHWAREWYPAGEYAVTGVTDREASVLVEVDGDIRILRYEDLDRSGPHCQFLRPRNRSQTGRRGEPDRA
jgi:hypothetical protein